MSEVRLVATSRETVGRSSARAARRAGQVPVVVYGHGADPKHLTVPGHDLDLALKHASNALLRLDLGGRQSVLALPKAIQRDPLSRALEHVDLIEVRRGEKVKVEVPVTFTGSARDGIITVAHATLAVIAEATSLPNGFEVDMSGAEVGDAVRAGDIELTEGVALDIDEDTLMAHVVALKVEAEAPAAEGEAAEGEVASAGAGDAAAEAAPAE